ncbi:inorganic phosphate transporter 1-6 [Hirschfeldia incana]|nr:inorganic phosphate transporter 1-6 [Hirschfeldia incana]
MASEGQKSSILTALDKTKTQCYHFTTVIISGMGFFTDSYDLFVISLITKLLGRIYYQKPGSSSPGSLPDGISATVSGVAFAGTFLGQIFFGCLGDKLGRKRVYGLTLVIMTICSICSGLSLGTDPKSVMTTLCFFRFWLGFGIGGDYPLSATIMSEYANKGTRGAFIASVFAMQGVGILAAGGVSLLVSYIFELHFPSPAYMVDPATSTVPQADYVWRIILMVGAIPALLTYYWRVKMPETARYTTLVRKDAEKAASDMSKVLNVDIDVSSAQHDQARVSSDEFGLFSIKFLQRHGLHLLATTTTWFLLDIAFYSQNLFQKDIFTTIGWLPPPKTMNAIQELFIISKAQFLIALCGTVPGYVATIFFIDRMGRYLIQVIGFLMMSISLTILAIPYHHWTLPHNRIGFVALYSLTFFFSNFGPNATTFIVPAEIFPARLRSTCHGISAASGKAGAMVGSFGFAALAKAVGMRYTLLIMAGISFAGMLLSLVLVPEPKGKSLEDLSGEAKPEKIKDATIVV